MKVLMSGINGFIGSHLAKELIKKKYDVHALVRHHPKPVAIPNEVTTYIGDLLDIYSLKKIIKSVQPDFIIHLAAMTPVRHSFENPFIYAETNLIGTMNLTIASKESSVLKKFIFASTAETYKSKDTPLIETDELYGTTPYGVSKVAADYWVRVSGDCYGLPYVILRPSNSYFRKTEKEYFIEKVITTMLTSNKLILDGTPDLVRDWMFVDDHVQGYMKVLESDTVNEVFNISTGVGTSLENVVNVVKETLNWNGEVVWGAKPRPFEPKYLVLNNGKAKKMIDFQSNYPLKKGLKIVIDYWKKLV